MSAGSAQAQDAKPEPVVGDTMPPRSSGDGLTFNGSVRARLEMPDRKLIDIDRGRDRAITFWRALAAADAKGGPVRGYVELASAVAVDDRHVAIETDRLDLHQAFVDLALPPREPRDLTRLRLGRAEMIYEFVALRDAPNVRRTWDGARITIARTGWTANAFDVRQVQPRTGVFDDRSIRSDRLAGAHLRIDPDTLASFGLTAWFYDVRQPLVQLASGVGAAHTQTLGLVLDRRRQGIGGGMGGGIQRGQSGGKGVRAYYLEGEVGYRRAERRWPTYVALRGSAFSGGATGGEVRTFNPLFPNFAFSTEAALQSPSNLVKAGLIAEAEPAKSLKLEYRGEALWRFSSHDAFYVPPGAPLAPADGSDDRWLGVQQQLRATWSIRPSTVISGALVHFAPGRFLRDAGRRDGTFAMFQLETRF